MIKEALNNILKHAGPCVATLSLTLEGGSLIAEVSDTGSGFDVSNPKAGNGLLNLAARAAELDGTCDIQSTPGQGTRIVLRCPLPKIQMLLPS